MFILPCSSDINNFNYGLLNKISWVIMYCALLYQDRLTEHFPTYMVLNFQNPSKDQNTKSELSLSNKAKCKQCLVLYSKLLGFRLFLAVLRPCFGPCFGPSVSQYNLWTTAVCIFNSKFLKNCSKNDI